MIRHRSTAAVLFLLCVASALGQDKTEKIEELLAAYHDLGLFNGSALVAEDGRVIFKGGFGPANAEWAIPNEPDTRFRLGSITKQFTAMVIMQLVDEGSVDLEAPMSRYLPEYRRDVADQVTIHHLLTHTSGIPSYTGLPGFMQNGARDPYEPEAFVEKFCSGDPEFEPGTRFRYNNSGYFLLGSIIEQVTGKSYEDALRERIFSPLHMYDTGYDHHSTIIEKRAAGYERVLDDLVNAPYLDMSIPYAAGSLYSTVEDLHEWDRALYTEELLPTARREQMFTPFMESYAYGWTVRDMPIGEETSTKVIAHGGGINGFNTLITRLVEDEHLIVLFSNAGGAPLDRMSRGITRILHGKEAKLPEERIERRLLATVLDEGQEEALRAYEAWRDTNDAEPALERRINDLGYQLLNNGRREDAIEVFRLNVSIFPKAFNTYDSLAEAYMQSGERELAIRNYAKSLDLNPDNRNAVEMLERIMDAGGGT